MRQTHLPRDQETCPIRDHQFKSGLRNCKLSGFNRGVLRLFSLLFAYSVFPAP
jgi:hypothetical protein